MGSKFRWSSLQYRSSLRLTALPIDQKKRSTPSVIAHDGPRLRGVCNGLAQAATAPCGGIYSMPFENPVMTLIPPFVNYPPELAYPPIEKTDIPDLVAKEVGSSRLVYFAGDIERTTWQSGNKDLESVASECHPLGIEDRGPGEDKREGANRNLCLGDAARICASYTELTRTRQRSRATYATFIRSASRSSP